MKRILLVDDNIDILEIAVVILNHHGFEVATHCTGFNVPEIVNEYRPDLILMDVLLYGKSGVVICEELKKLYNIPIILFSAHSAVFETFVRCSADDFIQKPFDVNELVDKIKFHLHKGESTPVTCIYKLGS